MRRSVIVPLFVFLLALAGVQVSVAQVEADREEPAAKPTAVSKSPQNRSPVCPAPAPRALLAGDSWAQYMWDDGSYNLLFNRFGHADKQMLSRSLGADPGPGYTGPEYAISGSEAGQWADTANYPWIANAVADLQANPSIDLFVLSIGGNDVLAGKSGGGWYKDMDLDVPGSEAALFAQIYTNTWQIVTAVQAVRPDLEVLISSYDYPNFTVSWLVCWAYACPKREDLSRDPVNDLITDAELNGMMVNVEGRRIGWTNNDPRVFYDNAVGLMHYYYGDGQSAAGTLPFPGQTPPAYNPFPGGNPQQPTLRANFRNAADPIHLSYDGYRFKIANQIMHVFLPRWRGMPSATFPAQGNGRDGWADGSSSGSGSVIVGDNGAVPVAGLLSFDTSALPDDALVTSASLYLMRESAQGSNPFAAAAVTPTLDVISGTFGSSAGVEPADATAPADANDAGCFYGSVANQSDALRVDVATPGLAAVNLRGTTQFRLAFPAADANPDSVSFYTGDATAVPDPLALPGLAHVTGTFQPFLDVTYCRAAGAVSDLAAAASGPDIALNWTAVSGATAYEVWTATNDPTFTPGTDCAAAANCTPVTGTAYTDVGVLGDPQRNMTYRVRAQNGCALTAVASAPVGTFTFPVQPGQ